MESQKLTVLFTAIRAHGHINACIGVAQALQQRGHRIVFTIGPTWKGKLAKYGFEEVLLIGNEVESKSAIETKDLNENETKTNDDDDYWTKLLAEKSHYLSCGSLQLLEHFYVSAFTGYAENLMYKETPRLQHIIDVIKPDLILNDNLVISPALVNSGIPWVWLVSSSVIYVIDDENTPPGLLGLPIEGVDKREWVQVREKVKQLYAPLFEKVNHWLINCYSMNPLKSGLPAHLHPPSPYANIYMMPKIGRAHV